MTEPRRQKGCCGPGEPMPGGVRVEAIAVLDERGQLLIPKDIRERFGLSPGSRLAVVSSSRDGKVCCLHVFKAEELSDAARNVAAELAR